MKKIIAIILFLFLFSIVNFANASEGYIGRLLQINVWPEAYDLSLVSIDDINFISSENQEVFNNFKLSAEILRAEILRQYEAGNISYYTMQGIIKNYKSFVYNTNKLFNYIAIKEARPYYEEADRAIKKYYSEVRIRYNRLSYLVNMK